MKKYIILAIVVFYSTIASWASELNVYPVPAVFTSKNVENSAFYKNLIRNRQYFTQEYLRLFDKYFTNVNKEITEKNKYKTFAAYIHVPRASQYYVYKTNKLLDIYLPLTMSLNFVNMASGEVLYSYPITNYFKYETTTTNDINEQKNIISQLCKKNYEQTMDEIIKTASNNFKPFDITAKITDTYRSLYVLDKGLETGIAKGDLLSDNSMNQISVIYSDLGYSVAIKVLGNPSINSDFSKFSNNSITQLKKPKILLINDFGSEKFYNIFSTALGGDAEFSLLNTDKTYFDMQTALVSLNNYFRTRNLYNKAMPDYFLKLYCPPPCYAQYKSKKDYFNVDKYGAMACAVIFDKSGRIVYSTSANNEFRNEVVGDIRFPDDANREIVGKNVIIELANNIKKNVQFKDIKFKIIKAENQYISVADPNGYLKSGNVLTIYKKIKTEKSGKEILVPTWDYRVLNSEKGVANCKMSKPYINGIEYPLKRDIIQMTTITRSANKANMFNYNPEDIELDGNEVKLESFENIAFAALTSTLKAPVAVPKDKLYEQFQELNTLGFKDKIDISDNDNTLNIKVVYNVKLHSEEAKGNVIKKGYEVIVGVIASKDDEVIKQDALKQIVTFVVPHDCKNDVIEYELIKAIYPLIQQIASKF